MSVLVVHEIGQQIVHGPIMPSLASFFGLPALVKAVHHQTIPLNFRKASAEFSSHAVGAFAATWDTTLTPHHLHHELGHTWNGILRLSQGLASFVAQENVPSLTERAGGYELLLSATCTL